MEIPTMEAIIPGLEITMVEPIQDLDSVPLILEPIQGVDLTLETIMHLNRELVSVLETIMQEETLRILVLDLGITMPILEVRILDLVLGIIIPINRLLDSILVGIILPILEIQEGSRLVGIMELEAQILEDLVTIMRIRREVSLLVEPRILVVLPLVIITQEKPVVLGVMETPLSLVYHQLKLHKQCGSLPIVLWRVLMSVSRQLKVNEVNRQKQLLFHKLFVRLQMYQKVLPLAMR